MKQNKFDIIKFTGEVLKELIDIIFKGAWLGFWIHIGWDIVTRIK